MRRWHGSEAYEDAANRPHVRITWVLPDGTERETHVPHGATLLEVAAHEDIDLEGACEGSLACSTCHVIIEDQDRYDALPEPEEEEEDMLDMAFGLTLTSRLGCQIVADETLDGLRVRVPSATRNLALDGYKPPRH